MPDPNPPVVHAKTRVTVDDIRSAFYKQARDPRMWIREIHQNPLQLIVADDADGTTVRVDVTISDDGRISFGPPVVVRPVYVEEPVAATTFVYATAAESRPIVANTTRSSRRPRVSDAPWSQFTPADYTPEQWRRATLLDTGQGDPDSKERYKLPVREPSGILNRNAIHAAAGGHGLGAVKGISDELRQATARKLVRLYRTVLQETPPDSLLAMAGLSVAAAPAAVEPPAAEPDQPTHHEEDHNVSWTQEVRRRLGLADDADEQAVLAAIDELKKKADNAVDPERVAAAAAENEALSQKVTLLEEQVADLSAQIAAANAEKAENRKRQVIDTAIAEGRIAPADRAKWEERYDSAPDVVTDVLASIAPGTAVPVDVKGSAGDPDSVIDPAQEAQFAEWDRLFSSPVPANSKGA